MGRRFFTEGRLIFLEARHTLHIRTDKTDVQLCLFRERTFAVFFSSVLEWRLVKFGGLVKRKRKMINALFITLRNPAKYLINIGFNDLQFAHVPVFNNNE